MKVLTIVGARPQFIKCAPVSRELRKVASEVLVHTGQHYDANMSEVFFGELQIPEPHCNLEVGSGSHGVQTGEMLKRIEEVLIAEQPNWVLVYGDTNSTLAGALAAVKLQIPVAHVEAGLRSYNRRMPEEINRILADHLSALLFAPTATAVQNLQREGITKGVHHVGDVMYDSALDHVRVAERKSSILDRLTLKPKSYYLATVHRAENTEDLGRLRNILEAFRQIAASAPLVWPVHPRSRRTLEQSLPAYLNDNALRLIEPLPYFDLLILEKNARAVLTDSGGVQKEACWFEVPCITLRDETEWVETLESGWNRLAGADTERILRAVLEASPPNSDSRANSHPRRSASRSIVEILMESVGPN